MIEVKHINKTFKVQKKKPGMVSAIKALFNPSYETIHALKDISFKINKGEIIGYIGPNGAGKSTTIKIMSGILTPDSGTCQINQITPWENRISHVKNIGVVFGQRTQLWWDIPVMDSFELLKDIYKINEKNFHETVALLSETLDLDELLFTPVRQLSLGQRMRCEIAASLLHEPDILFLDEPTIGLDALSKAAVRAFIKTINQLRKTTVILTTHDMSDIEALADRVILIGKGQVLYDGDLKSIKEQYIKSKKLIIDHHQHTFDYERNGVHTIYKSEERLELNIDIQQKKVSEVISELSSQLDIIDMTVEDPSVDDIIIDMYKEFDI